MNKNVQVGRNAYLAVALRIRSSMKTYAAFGILVVFIAIFSAIAPKVSAATYTWDGGGADENWSTCANWSTNICPVATDSVTFNATSTKNAIIDGGFQGTVANITIGAGYSGTITASRSFTVSSNFIQGAGTFDATSSTLNFNVFSLTSATFTASSNTTNLGGSLTINPGSTFNHNGGTLNLVGISPSTYSCNNAVFNLVTVNKNYDVYATHTVNSNCTFPVGNNPFLRFARNTFIINGAITGSGTITITRENSNPGLAGDVTFRIGSTGQFIGFDGLVQDIGTTFELDGGTLNLSSYTNVSLVNLYLSNNAVFTAPSGTMTISGAYAGNGVYSNGNISVITGAIFNANGGTVNLGGNNTLTGSITFHNLNKSCNSGWAGNIEEDVAAQAGSVQTVLGDLAINGCSAGRPINLISSTPGAAWTLNVIGAASAFAITVTDVNNISASSIIATQSVNNGNSAGWIVTPPTQPASYAATDMLGQIDGGGLPVWRQNTAYNGAGYTTSNQEGMYYPVGTVLDTKNHRLFVSECGYRVLVFNLDSSNNLIDRVADYVLGQPDFTSQNSVTTQSSLDCPVGASYDSVHDRLFVPEWSNRRVLVFDLSNGITNGMNASYVLGQPDFVTNTDSTTQSGMSSLWGGSAYDTTTEHFYVSDYNNSRVLVFDLSNGITNGMNASYVLGQPDFTSNTVAVTQSGMSYPYGMAVDTQHSRLFVADWGTSGRVLVYDISPTNLQANPQGMNAIHVLGQPDFTASIPAAPTQSSIAGPGNLIYDSARQRLFAQDDINNRVMVFDLQNGITDGMNATAVLGQESFTENQYDCMAWQTDQCDAEGGSDAFDISNNRLWLSDSGNNRVLLFNFVSITTSSLPNGSNGSTYSQQIMSQNFQGSISYSVKSGSLPPGLTLNANGLLSGTPNTDGTYTFTIEVRDENSSFGYFTDHKEYVMQVQADSDGDSIADATETSSPLGGDVNGDTINDYLQPIVATSFNPIANEYTTMVVQNCTNGFTRFANIAAADLPAQDTTYTYPLGLQDFSVDCGVVGATATFTQYLEKIHDTSSWKYRKFIPGSGYLDITNSVVLGTATVNGVTVTTVSFSVTDGSIYDADGTANGRIDDPLGVAIASSELADTGLNMVTIALASLGAISTGIVCYFAITRRYA